MDSNNRALLSSLSLISSSPVDLRASTGYRIQHRRNGDRPASNVTLQSNPHLLHLPRHHRLLRRPAIFDLCISMRPLQDVVHHVLEEPDRAIAVSARRYKWPIRETTPRPSASKITSPVRTHSGSMLAGLALCTSTATHHEVSHGNIIGSRHVPCVDYSVATSRITYHQIPRDLPWVRKPKEIMNKEDSRFLWNKLYCFPT